ncbi:MAG: MBL fold metallo-hydrolase [Bacillaceae bacterium]|nr:MBL fold metallo-hydrolase [Bacillaceae bacterium]
MKEIHKLVIPTPFMVGPVNLYLIEGDALTLIDAGPKTDEARESLIQQLKELGIQPSDIDQVILTHHHMDHVGLLDYLREVSSFKLLGHPRNQSWISQDKAFYDHHEQFFMGLYRSLGVPEKYLDAIPRLKQQIFRYSCSTSLDLELREGDTVPGLPGWRVIETPGHARSHISLYRETDGLMIGGDHIIGHISSNALTEPPDPNMGDVERPLSLLMYRESLKRCQTFEISKVLAGHGEEVTGVHDLIETRLQKQMERAQLMKSWIESESMTCFDICCRLFPKVYQQQLALTMSETLGHLDLLVDMGEARIEEKDGVYYYHGAK